MTAPLAHRARAALVAGADPIAAEITRRHFDAHPELELRYGEAGRRKCHADSLYHLRYLAEAVAAGRSELFDEYVVWARSLLVGLGIPPDDLDANLGLTLDVVNTLDPALDPDVLQLASTILKGARARLRSVHGQPPSFIRPENPHHDLARAYLDVLLAGDRRAASSMIGEAVEGGTAVGDIYLSVFQVAQWEVGRLWQLNQITVAQEHYCSAATQLVMSQLYGHIFSSERRDRAMLATSVGGELHEIGIRMVADFFEMDGWDTYYLGANIPAVSVLEAVESRDPCVVAISATITTHVLDVETLIHQVRQISSARILVGGYPFNLSPGLWESVGADASAEDGPGAVRAANKLLGGGP